MVCGIRPECNQKCNGHWCNPCNPKMILIIGRLNANGWRKVLGYISYDRFKDVKQIGKGGFGTINLLGGLMDQLENGILKINNGVELKKNW
ncbi:hypothetical protein Glove_194g157 [Diversispora epigaea]|uniref:Protein kinase domain-containing protein n=1 Tax=Diversispora epigaea TaxID=1348612 RepID=A0A397IQU1_9GLOM|nr:hypothetical protein Glove_194g157 [Diversispora epigaea]